jgi:LysM repeat protein
MMRIAIAAVALLFAATGCMTQKAKAPVDDRRPTATAPKPLVVEPALAPAPPPPTYTVKRGDTIYSIALELGVDHRDLARWNKLDDPTKIKVGQALRTVPSEEDSAVQIGAARGPAASKRGRSTARPAPAAPALGEGRRRDEEPRRRRCACHTRSRTWRSSRRGCAGRHAEACRSSGSDRAASRRSGKARRARPRSDRFHLAGARQAALGIRRSRATRASTSRARSATLSSPPRRAR